MEASTYHPPILTDVNQDEDNPNLVAQAAEAENTSEPPVSEANGNANDEEEGGAAVIAEAATAAAADEDDSSVAAANNEAAEDIPTELVEDSENEGAEEANAMALGALVEQNDEVHRQRKAAYEARKNHLISTNWKVTIKAPKKKGIEIGDRVSDRGANPRFGIVVSGRKDPDSKRGNLWTMLFDGDEQATIDIKYT